MSLTPKPFGSEFLEPLGAPSAGVYGLQGTSVCTSQHTSTANGYTDSPSDTPSSCNNDVE